VKSQFGASLTGNSRGDIYARNVFIIQAFDLYSADPLALKINLFKFALTIQVWVHGQLNYARESEKISF
jgi:hypothetical protein